MNCLNGVVYVFIIYSLTNSYCYDCNLNNFPTIRLTYFRNIKELDVANGTSVKVSARDLSKYTNNYNIYIYGTKLRNVCNEFIKQLSGVDEIEFQDIGIINIQPYSFTSSYNLRTVGFYYSTLRNIPSGAFSNSSITTLRIEGNKVDYLASDAFDNMLYLEYLNLNENNLKTIDAAWFRNCPRLSLLDLANNGIKYLPRGAFKNLIASRTCNIIENKVSCPEIILTGNKINNISKEVFDGMEHINHLVLDNNLIRDIPNIFNNVNINILSLKSNFIECVSEEVLASFINMAGVYLEFNHIKPNCANRLRQINNDNEVTITL